jgi:hypothetical protein
MAAPRRIAALACSLAGVSVLAAGCGGQTTASGGPQDENEPKGDFPVRVETATFPAAQSLAKDSSMRIVVVNAGQKDLPNVNVTVKCGKGLGGSFMVKSDAPDLADPERPQFVVNTIPTATQRQNPPLDPAPLERSSAFVDTYPLGPLAPGKRATFVWNVTAVKAGPYKLCWKVNAGLYGKATATKASDSKLPISGTFAGDVSNKAPKAKVANDGKTVIESSGP